MFEHPKLIVLRGRRECQLSTLTASHPLDTARLPNTRNDFPIVIDNFNEFTEMRGASGDSEVVRESGGNVEDVG